MNRRTPRGAVLVAVVVCIAITTALIVTIASLALARRSEARSEAWRVQARWLAESAIDRAAARLAADAKYGGETWNLPAEALGGQDAGVVQIEVGPVEGRAAARLVRAQADYPDDPVHRVRVSRERTIEIEKKK